MSAHVWGARDDRELARALTEVFLRRARELFLVGGPVRDRLLGISSPDLDFATSALPDETASILLDLTGREPYRIGEEFGTIGLRIQHRTVEITTYRTGELYLHGSRKPSVRFGATLQEDLERRDFTINAMAQDPISGEIIDPVGGRDDLRRRVVRAVGRPAERFEEDPLRLLRGIRFASRLAFAVDPATWEAMRDGAAEIERISRERVRDEYSRMLTDGDTVRALQLLRDSGSLGHTVPQLLELTRMTDHGPRHPLSLWDHTMRVVAGVPPTLAARWAALLHDIAKPATRTHEPSGRPRFFHHEEVGAEMAREILTSLRYPNAFVDDVACLVGVHMQLHAYSSEWSDGAVRRLVLRLGPLMADAIALVRADGAGHSLTGTSANSPKFDEFAARIERLEHDGLSRPRSPLNGAELMQRYGRSPGPWIREIKSALENEVMEGRLGQDETDRAWEIADRMVGMLQT